MANADGSVIFSCDLDSTKAQKKLSKLRDEISELNSKLEKETGNKMNLEKQLDAASQAAKATEERVKMLRKEVERLNDREWIQKQGFTQNEYQTQVLDRRAAAEAELKQQEALLRTQTKEVKTLSAAYEETTANINSMTVKLDKAKVAAGELIANTEQERREREAENSALAKAGQYAARFRDQVKSLARSRRQCAGVQRYPAACQRRGHPAESQVPCRAWRPEERNERRSAAFDHQAGRYGGACAGRPRADQCQSCGGRQNACPCGRPQHQQHDARSR